MMSSPQVALRLCVSLDRFGKVVRLFAYPCIQLLKLPHLFQQFCAALRYRFDAPLNAFTEDFDLLPERIEKIR